MAKNTVYKKIIIYLLLIIFVIIGSIITCGCNSNDIKKAKEKQDEEQTDQFTNKYGFEGQYDVGIFVTDITIKNPTYQFDMSINGEDITVTKTGTNEILATGKYKVVTLDKSTVQNDLISKNILVGLKNTMFLVEGEYAELEITGESSDPTAFNALNLDIFYKPSTLIFIVDQPDSRTYEKNYGNYTFEGGGGKLPMGGFMHKK